MIGTPLNKTGSGKRQDKMVRRHSVSSHGGGGGGGGWELLPPGLISSGNYTAYKHITSSLLHHYDVICTGDDTQRTDSREQRSTSPSQRSASFGRAGTVRKNINRSVKIVNRSVGQHHLLNT